VGANAELALFIGALFKVSDSFNNSKKITAVIMRLGLEMAKAMKYVDPHKLRF
jgi:hypothetical protein